MRRLCNKYIKLLRRYVAQRTEHVRVGCSTEAKADGDWLVAFAWAAVGDRRSAARRVRLGRASGRDLEWCRVHRGWVPVKASAVRSALGGERVSEGEARRIPACWLSSVLRFAGSQQGLCRLGFLPSAGSFVCSPAALCFP